ncbi:unnamed protein product [Ranitomeya imitator]|uniref:NXPE family member 3-like n=1 Tax=Ranitomeya imitator TaxID=111125 RepID=A0ABN9MBL5_9NEOB|nr:unnamed protein product [Ranitomeya imitator]
MNGASAPQAGGTVLIVELSPAQHTDCTRTASGSDWPTGEQEDSTAKQECLSLNTIRTKIISIFAIFFITLLSFIIYLKPKDFQNLHSQYISMWKQAQKATQTTEPKSIEVQISELMSLINRTVPNVDFRNLNATTSAKNSKATIVDEKPTYCVGDTITVRLEMYNYLGEKKNSGGDFLRAHIYSLKLEAGASGEIKDFNNGTYNVYFTLFWEGEVKISVLLMHPSEGVSALWKSRNHGYKYIKYTGKFLNKIQAVETECGFSLETKEEKCNYVDRRYGEFFYCIRPPGVACEAFIYLKSENSPYTNLTKIQKNLFTRIIFALREKILHGAPDRGRLTPLVSSASRSSHVVVSRVVISRVVVISVVVVVILGVVFRVVVFRVLNLEM